jgi:ABC-2 type transport system ATP-binding protein
MQAAERTAAAATRGGRAAASPAVELQDVRRNFGRRVALAGVSLCVDPGEIHALLGPNGAGKTTLLRVLAGLIEPDAGTVRVLGEDASRPTRAQRAIVGLVPSGDRTFYLRISGLENLRFFARLHGLSRRDAAARAHEVLEAVDLDGAARQPVGEYSHGMQKRLSVARALLTRPRVLLVDEATHDLDPHAARVVRELVRRLAGEGTAVLLSTQRIDEIRGLAEDVTLLRSGEVAYAGSVVRLAARARVRRHVLRLQRRASGDPPGLAEVAGLLAGVGSVVAAPEEGVVVLTVDDEASLGDALSALLEDGVDVLSCREVQSEIEEAFVQLTSVP